MVLARNGHALHRQSFLGDVFPQTIELLADRGVTDIAPIAMDFEKVTPVHPARPLLYPDAIVEQDVGLLKDFLPRLRPRFLPVVPQLRPAPRHLDLPALVEANEVFVVASRLCFDVCSLRVGRGPGSVAMFVVAGCFDHGRSADFFVRLLALGRVGKPYVLHFLCVVRGGEKAK